jgi:ketosteroid isomerase-like protein
MRKWITLTLFLFFGSIVVFSVFAQKDTKNGGRKMTIEQNKQLVQRLFNEVFNQRALAVIDEIYTPNMVDHSAFPGQAPGTEGIKSAINGFFEIITDLEVTVEDAVAEDDKVVTRETWRGTHRPFVPKFRSGESALWLTLPIGTRGSTTWRPSELCSNSSSARPTFWKRPMLKSGNSIFDIICKLAIPLLKGKEIDWMTHFCNS